MRERQRILASMSSRELADICYGQRDTPHAHGISIIRLIASEFLQICTRARAEYDHRP